MMSGGGGGVWGGWGGVGVWGGWGGLGCGVGGMFPFVASAHIFTATPHDNSCT